MKALLLVGGLATRLRPLSLNRPKCLFPLKNKPIIKYLLENLANSGCDEAVLAVNNLAEKIQSSLGGEQYNIKIHYSLEEEPLGTGGPIKLAEDLLADDDFLVLNGDILSFINYKELLYYHKKNNSVATITLKEVEDPTRYGVVKFAEEETIEKFVEKPTIESAPSKWINAGCYALSPKIFDYIPSGKKVSIEREVFPKLAEKRQLKGYRYYGEWLDIGVPEDYLTANKMLYPYRDKSSSISPFVIVGKNTVILDSIIWENTKIGNHSQINGSIIGANCILGDNIRLTKVVLGDNVIINENIEVVEGVKIWPNNHIQESIITPNLEIK